MFCLGTYTYVYLCKASTEFNDLIYRTCTNNYANNGTGLKAAKGS